MPWGLKTTSTVCKQRMRKKEPNRELHTDPRTPKLRGLALCCLECPLEHHCRVSMFHYWLLRKPWHALKKCKRVLHSTQLLSLQATNTPHSHLLHCHTPCFQVVLYTQLSVSGTCFNLSFISNTHHKALLHKTTNSFSPPSKKLCPKEHSACEITCTARWDRKTEGSSAP